MLTTNNYNEFFSTYETSGYLPSLKYIPNNFTVENNTLSYDVPSDQKTIYYGSLPDMIFFQDDLDVRWDILHNLNSLCVDLSFYYIDGDATTLTQYGCSNVSNIARINSILYFQQIDGKNNVCIFSPETEETNLHYYLNTIIKKSIYGFNYSSSFYGLQGKGMKYSELSHEFIVGETIQNAIENADVTGTALILENNNSGTNGQLILTDITGTWTIDDLIYSSTGVLKAYVKPEYGEVFFNVQSNDTSNKINWLSTRKTDSLTLKADTTELNGTLLQHIDFTTSFNDVNYVLFNSINTSYESNFYTSIITNKDVNGFDIQLSSQFDANEYNLDWYALNINGLTNAGIVSIPKDSTSLTINIPSGYDEYVIFYSIENNVDFGTTPTSAAFMFFSTISDKSSDGFTLNFSTVIPSENYKVNWMILSSLDSSLFKQKITAIWPKEVELIDTNNAKGYFTQPFQGLVNIKKLGNIVDEKEKYPVPIGTNNVFSPHYKVELDINNEPISTSERAVISNKIEKSLYEEWEKFRPEGKVAHYQIYFLIDKFSSYGTPSSYSHYGTSIDWKHNFLINFNTASNAYIYSNMNDSSSTWTISHNLGTKSIIIQTFTYDLQRIYPKHIFLNNLNEIEIQFSNEQKGYVFISKASKDESFYINKENQIINYEHNLGTNNLIFQIDKQFYDKESFPYSLTMSDENIVSFTYDKLLSMNDPLYGNILILNGDGIYEQTEASELWEIHHNSGYKIHMFQVFDENNQEVIPKNIEFIDENMMSVTFGSPIAGKIVLKNIGNNPQYSDGVLLEKAQKGNLELRIGNKKESLAAIQMKSTISNLILTQEITSCEVTDTYITLNFEIPWNNNYEIYQWGLYEKATLGNLLYAYSSGDLIYKIKGMNLLISYKIKREI